MSLHPVIKPKANGDLWLYFDADPNASAYVIDTPSKKGILAGKGKAGATGVRLTNGPVASISVTVAALYPQAVETAVYPPVVDPPPPVGVWPRKGCAHGAKVVSKTAAAQDAEFQATKDAGAQVSRLDYWSSQCDATFQRAINHGLRIIACIGGTVKAPGPGTSSYASLTSQCVSRFKDHLVAVECANEWDLQGFTPASIAPYLKAAYTASKSLASSLPVMNGGIFKGNGVGMPKLIQGLYDAGCRDFMDAVCLHLYDDPSVRGDWNCWDQAFRLSPSVRSVMDAHGDQNKLIISTESGSSGSTAAKTHVVQAAFADFASRQHVGTLCIFSMANDDYAPGWGLLDNAGNRTAAWDAYKAAS